MSDRQKLLLRLFALGIGSVLLQIAGVAQITVLGVNADITPLVVATVGFMCGAVGGAAMGFGMGLFIDMALVQTLGVSALIYTLLGYGAGRLRELRAPESALTPIALGAAATAVATFGYAVLEFLLGVDAPVSWLLLRDIVATILVNTVIALPVFLAVRRWLTPAMDEGPRRRRRRAYTTGGLSPLSRS
jgi:rod shape-determining protein MreD